MPNGSSTGYSTAMSRVQERLRAIGLPDTLFDADFPDQLEAAKERYRRLSARYAEMMQSEAFKDLPMPFESLNVDSLEWLCLVQGRRPKWAKGFLTVNKFYRDDGNMRPHRAARRIAATGRLPAPNTKLSKRLRELGYDLNKLVTEGYEAARPPRKA